MDYNYEVLYEHDEDGVIIASVPAIRGCHSHGRTMEEAEKNIREAIELCLEVMRENGEPIPISP